jgi:superfamily II DNA or RNA helicase
MKTYLGRKGYTIYLKDFKENQIEDIKNDLTFKPFRPKGYGPEAESFSIYGISDTKMFLPKFYGIKKFGKTKIKLKGCEDINIKFNGSLRENQKEPVKECINSLNSSGGGILCLPCGYGKCLGINTPVMMHDGSVKLVQYIKVNDKIMGDDLKERNILSLARGKEQMYKIYQDIGINYVVNESHILSLYYENKGFVKDISVINYLKLPNIERKKLFGYKISLFDKKIKYYKIFIKKLNVDNYYGFEIDGNKRFLLGDTTVTHNTSIALYLVASLGVKTLVVVNKEFLMDQWKERIKQFLPTARIGLLRQKKIDIDDKDIVIGMLQSISMCDYDRSIYKSFGFSIYDEVHCVPSRIFSKSLRKVNTKYHLGLSATPNRADGMTKVIKLYLGPIIYKVDTRKAIKNPKGLKVYTFSFNNLPKTKHYKSLLNYQRKPNVVKMISNIIECPKRLVMITTLLEYFLKQKRHILVLSERIKYLHEIKNEFTKKCKNYKIGYYIGGMKSKERKDSESANLILASYSMAKEAMDIPILDTLLMVTSKSNIEQSVGRIMRKSSYPKDKPPLVIDIVDNFSSFQSQSYKRIKFYNKKKYPVTDFIVNLENINLIKDEIKNYEEKIKEEESKDEIEENISLDDYMNTNILNII